MKLVLHIGAHRTGSTLIERALAATVAARADCGDNVSGPELLRQCHLQPPQSGLAKVREAA